MNVSEESVITLTELGLSSTQAKVYLTLVKAANLTAHAISRGSGVARPDVYRVLAQLEEAGVVERIISKPIEFRAISIDECVSTLMKQRLEKTAELSHKVQVLAQNFRRKDTDEKLDEKFQFTLLPERAAVYAKAEKMLSNVQESICLLGLTRRMIAWLSNYSPMLEKALARKVNCKMIMPKPETPQDLEEPMKTMWKYPTFALRLIPKSPTAGFSIWDKKEILITTSAVDTSTPAPTLWSNNKSLVDLAQDYFEYLWMNAVKIRLKKE